jgi:hypothetical protein
MYLLVSWCVGGECDMTNNDEDRGRSRRLGAEDRRWLGTSRVLSGWMIGRSGDFVYDPYRTHGWDEKSGFPGLASKPVAIVWWFGSQNHCDGFLVWTSKPCRRRFVYLCLKTDERMKTVWGHASTFGGLLHHEASRIGVSQFCLKTGKGATAGGARGIITMVTWKWRRRQTVR